MRTSFIEHHDAIDVYRVIEQVAPDDKAEIEAVRGKYDPVDVAIDLFRRTSWRFKVEEDHAEAVGGFTEVWPGYGTMWMFTTPRFREVVNLGLLKIGKKSMIRALKERGVHRAEARCMENHVLSRRWIEFMGGKQDCKLPSFGILKEDFLQYSWVI